MAGPEHHQKKPGEAEGVAGEVLRQRKGPGWEAGVGVPGRVREQGGDDGGGGGGEGNDLGGYPVPLAAPHPCHSALRHGVLCFCKMTMRIIK